MNDTTSSTTKAIRKLDRTHMPQAILYKSTRFGVTVSLLLVSMLPKRPNLSFTQSTRRFPKPGEGINMANPPMNMIPMKSEAPEFPITPYTVRLSLKGYSTPMLRTQDPSPTCVTSDIPLPDTPLTPPSPPSHHKTVLSSSAARRFACSHMAKPTVGSHVLAGASIRAGLLSSAAKVPGMAKSRQMEAVNGTGLVNGGGAQSGFFTPDGFFMSMV